MDDNIHSLIYYQVAAGVSIGMATKSPCTNHIHFAMKKGNGFIDPTKFLEARLFKFKPWEQYCDDYLLVWKVRIFLYLYCFLGKKNFDTTNNK